MDQKEVIQNHFQGNYHQFYTKYLNHVKKIGGQEYQALCPFHEDTNPSFNFSNETGTYFCHGCSKKGEIFHFYAKLHGFNDRKDFPKILNSIVSDFGIAYEKKERRCVKTYDYTDQEGKLLYQVCRCEPKDFYQRRPDGNGGWINNLKGIQTVLYRLPKIQTSEEVIIVEGEKDADNLALLGLCATTCPMGAKKWKDHYNEFLKDKNLILCPDNDNEGREHMTQVAISLNGTSKSLKWIDLPGLPSKGDVSDWILTFSDPQEAAERLAIMIENAEPYKPPKEWKKESIETERGWGKDLIQILDEPEIEEEPAIVEGLLYPEDHGFVVSTYKLGKTLFMTQLTLCLAMRMPFLCFSVPMARKVLYIRFELVDKRFRKRLSLMVPGLGGRDKIQKIPIFHLTRRFDIRNPKDFDWLSQMVDRHEPDCLFIDPFYKLSRLDLKETSSPIPIIEKFDLIHDKYPKLHVSIAHHLKKLLDGNTESWDSAYGGMQFWANMDYQIRLSRKGNQRDTFKFSYISNDQPVDDFTFVRNSQTLLYELEPTELLDIRMLKDYEQIIALIRKNNMNKSALSTFLQSKLQYTQREAKDCIDYLLANKKLAWKGFRTHGYFTEPQAIDEPNLF